MSIIRRDFLKYSTTSLITLIGGISHPISGLANTNSQHGTSQPQHYLFVDDRIVVKKQDVRLTVNQCRKLDSPVIAPENPWEQNRVYTYGSVFKHPKTNTYHMWYMSRLNTAGGGKDRRLNATSHDLVLFAESTDGLHWEKPELGLYSYNGSSRNNIVHDLHSPSVLFDTSEPIENRRYKMMGFGSRGKQRGYCISWSGDGLNWQHASDKPVIIGGDTVTLMKNPLTGEYCAYHKQSHTVRGFSRRTVWLSKSRDFIHWTEPVLVFAPDNQDDSWASGHDQRTEFYNMTVSYSSGLFLGFVSVFRINAVRENVQPHQSRVDGPVYTEIVYSYDGVLWKRFPARAPIIPNGPSQWDSGCILGVSNPLITNDEVWIYYTGINTTHGGAMPPKKCVIGRASWRRDGFVSLDSGGDGIVETGLLKATGKTLIVNADASEGKVIVELLDHTGKVISGYNHEQCRQVSTDSIYHKIQWKSRGAIPQNMPIQLRFYCQNTKLFSFTL